MMKQVIFSSINTFCGYREKVRTKKFIYVQTQIVWYQCERWKEEMYVYVTETTHIYMYCWAL